MSAVDQKGLSIVNGVQLAGDLGELFCHAMAVGSGNAAAERNERRPLPNGDGTWLRQDRRYWRGAGALMAALAFMGPFTASTPAGADDQPAQRNQAATQLPAESADFWHRDTMTGDWGGLRSWLADQGVNININYTGEALGNAAGGVKQGTIYEGLLMGSLDADLQKLAGWNGASLHLAAYELEGHGLTNGYVDSLLTVSGIEGRPANRLFTVWVEQQGWNSTVSLRLGVMALDAEFFTSDTAGLFVGATFGWPEGVADNMPGGGPIYPLSAPGVRLKIQPTSNFKWLTAITSGDPTGGNGSTFPLEAQPGGTLFSFSGGALVVTEADLSINKGKDAAGLPVTFKLGAFYDTGAHFSGLPPQAANLANHYGEWEMYGIVDGMLYRRPGTDDQGVSSFLRVASGPSESNLINLYSDAGMVYKGLLPGRPNDLAGLALAYAHISSTAHTLDQAFGASNGTFFPDRNYELQMELSYQIPLTPWWTLQPDLQTYFHPSGYVIDPTQRVSHTALILGLRTTVTF